ncbi:AN1-type zinc finger protein 4, partial [Armadillidium nasatum]
LPSSHQHILKGSEELLDDTPLIDQGVQEGSCLRLVLAMKGGPINSRRMPVYEDNLWKDFSDYMEVNREELWENEPGRPVTLLVLREGDAVNLYRVVENDDGTFSPLNESWSSNRTGSGKTDRSDKESLIEETIKHQNKMTDLAARMEALKIRKREKKRKKKTSKPGSPSVRVSSANRIKRHRSSLTSRLSTAAETESRSINTHKIKSTKSAESFTERYQVSPRAAGNSNRTPDHPLKTPTRSHLPPVFPTGKYYPGSSVSRPNTHVSSNDYRRVSLSRSSRIMDEISMRAQSRHVEFSYHPKLESIPQRERKSSLHTLKEDTPSFKQNKDYFSGRNSEYYINDEKEKESEKDNLREIKESREAWSGRDVPFPLYIGHGNSKLKRRFRRRLNHSYNVESLALHKDLDDRPKTSPEILDHRPGSAGTSSTMSDKIHLRGPDERLKELISVLNSSRANSRISEVSSINPVPPLKDLPKPQNKSMKKSNKKSSSGNTSLSTSFTSIRNASSPSPPFTPRGAGSLRNSKSQEQMEILKDLLRNQNPVSRLSTPDKGLKITRRPNSGQFKASMTPRSQPNTSPRTPKKKAMKKRPRCRQCKKKIGVATSYACRCGLVFCAQHRYAETHNCTYDYKSAGKKIIEIANPLVIPEKLPKI